MQRHVLITGKGKSKINRIRGRSLIKNRYPLQEKETYTVIRAVICACAESKDGQGEQGRCKESEV